MEYKTLAEKEGLGRVVICNGCNDIHLAVDSVTMRITQDAFVALAEMVQCALQHPKLSAALNTHVAIQPCLN